MGIHSLKKVIAVGILIAFIGVAVTWAMEHGSPQFQEKAGTPVVKKPHKFPWIIALLGVAAVGVGVYFLTKKKSDESSGGVYTITLQNKDVVTDAAVNGNLLVKLANGTQVTGTSGGQFKCSGSNSITDILVTSAPGHYTGYVVITDADGNVVAYKDRAGMNKPITVVDGKQYHARLISDSIDTKLLAKCVGNQVDNKDLGDGTIQNYSKSEVKVAIRKAPTETGQDPTAYTVSNLGKALAFINAIPHNPVKLVYAGIVSDLLTDGITYSTANVSPSGGFIMSGNTIVKSGFAAPADVSLNTLVEEVMNGTGLRFDAGDNNPYDGKASPYISGGANNPVWVNNAEYAYCLANGDLPLGFQLSTTSVPASQLPSPMSISQPGSLMSTGSTREYAPIGPACGSDGKGKHYSVPKPVVGKDARVKEREERQ